MFRKTIISLAMAAALTGCASFPSQFETGLTPMAAVEETANSWSAQPALQYIPAKAGIVVRRHQDMPVELANKRVEYDMRAGMPLSALAEILTKHLPGARVLAQGFEGAGPTLQLPKFKGTLRELLDLLEVAHDVSYEYRRGVLFIVPAARYEVTLPQHQAVLDAVAAMVGELGAADVRKDLAAGKLFYVAKPSAEEQIRLYLDTVAKNAAMVTLQVAVLDVRLNRDFALGMDWSQFSVEKTNGAMRDKLTDTLGELITVSGSTGIGYKLVKEGFTLMAAIRALSRFGEARTDQNVLLSTLSGSPVKLTSGTQIPYVKSIGATTTSNSNSVTGSAQTDVVRSGLTLEITPQYDAEDALVMAGVKVDMSSLVGFRELNAGNNLGTLSQPEIQEMKFENIGRLRPGETMIVGGLTYDQMTTAYTSLPKMEQKPVGSENKQLRKNAIYIVLRPTILLFGEPPKGSNAAPAKQIGASSGPTPQPEAPVSKSQTSTPEPSPQLVMPANVKDAPRAKADALAKAKALLAADHKED